MRWLSPVRCVRQGPTGRGAWSPWTHHSAPGSPPDWGMRERTRHPGWTQRAKGGVGPHLSLQVAEAIDSHKPEARKEQSAALHPGGERMSPAGQPNTRQSTQHPPWGRGCSGIHHTEGKPGPEFRWPWPSQDTNSRLWTPRPPIRQPTAQRETRCSEAGAPLAPRKAPASDRSRDAGRSGPRAVPSGPRRPGGAGRPGSAG